MRVGTNPRVRAAGAHRAPPQAAPLPFMARCDKGPEGSLRDDAGYAKVAAMRTVAA